MDRADADTWRVRRVSDVDVPALGLFCLAYAHLLLVLDDEEFFGKQRPFSLGEQRCVSFYVRMGN